MLGMYPMYFSSDDEDSLMGMDDSEDSGLEDNYGVGQPHKKQKITIPKMSREQKEKDITQITLSGNYNAKKIFHSIFQIWFVRQQKDPMNLRILNFRRNFRL
jgi:hypothetical protein